MEKGVQCVLWIINKPQTFNDVSDFLAVRRNKIQRNEYCGQHLKQKSYAG